MSQREILHGKKKSHLPQHIVCVLGDVSMEICSETRKKKVLDV